LSFRLKKKDPFVCKTNRDHLCSKPIEHRIHEINPFKSQALPLELSFKEKRPLCLADREYLAKWPRRDSQTVQLFKYHFIAPFLAI
jgi:hypothetical protein